MSKQQRPYGGYWTQVKLERVRQYLSAFVEEMEDQPYKTVYVDAFAGSGIVTMPKPEKQEGGFNLVPVSDEQPCIEGSETVP
jgi:three-Cys-motif partner protein